MKDKLNVGRGCGLLCISINHFEVLGYRAGFVEDRTTGDKMGPETGFSLTFVSFPKQTKEIAVDEELLNGAIRKQFRGGRDRQNGNRESEAPSHSVYGFYSNASTGAYLFNVYCVYSTTQPLSSAGNSFAWTECHAAPLAWQGTTENARSTQQRNIQTMFIFHSLLRSSSLSFE